MLNLNEAKEKLLKSIPGAIFQSNVETKTQFIFLIIRPDEFEEEYDNFFSVEKETGFVSDFSIIEDDPTFEVRNAFIALSKKE